MFIQGIFYLFAFLLLSSAAMVITVRNPVYAALFLVLSFFSMAAIWLLLLAEFLAIIIVLVYVGAVMVLFLFIVMLLDIDFSVLRAGFTRYLWPGLLVAVLMSVATWIMLNHRPVLPEHALAAKDSPGGNTLALGQALFTEHLYAFEVAGAILLVAIVAAISLTLREGGKRNKSIPPHVQIQAKKSERLRVLDMPASDKS